MSIFKILKIFLILFYTFIFIQVGVFAESKKDMTIGEIKNNIKDLKQETQKIDNNWKNFLLNNGEIKDFLKKDLNKEEIYKILELSKNISKITNRREKVKFYKTLFPFIDSTKKENFFGYINREVSKLNKEDIINTKIVDQKKVLNKKVKKYEQIKNNYDKKTNIYLEKVIRKKISLLINKIEQKDSFNKIKKEKVIFIYNSFINKINLRRKKLLESFNKNNSKMQRKLIIYNVMKEILSGRIEFFQKQIKK